MKFTKEQAYKDLVAKLTAKGEKLNLSERSINEQLDKLIPLVSDDETELDSFVERVLPFMQTANANVRNDVSEGINKYKEEHKDDLKPKEEPIKPKDDDPNKELLERLAKLEEQLTSAKAKETEAETRKALLAKMKEVGIKNDDWAKDFTEDITIGEDFDVDATANKLLERYNKYMAYDGDDDYTPEDPTSGNGKKKVDDVVAQAAKIAKATRYGSDDE